MMIISLLNSSFIVVCFVWFSVPGVELGVARASCESGSASVTQHRQPQPGLACVGVLWCLACVMLLPQRLHQVQGLHCAPNGWLGMGLKSRVTLETVYVCSSGRLLICNPPALVLK